MFPNGTKPRAARADSRAPYSGMRGQSACRPERDATGAGGSGTYESARWIAAGIRSVAEVTARGKDARDRNRMANMELDAAWRRTSKDKSKARSRRRIGASGSTPRSDHFNWSATLARPAMAHFSSPSELDPLTPTAPIVSLPTLMGTPPRSAMTSASSR